MTISKKPYKGCRDFFPETMRERSFIFDKMHETSKLFSYEPYDGPLLEEVALYLAKSGEELIGEQIYDFTDKGNRHVAIRPEMTPTVARMAAQVHRETVKPIRWYSISNFMRYEKPQRGRLREFTQLNIDIFGAEEHLAAFEVLDYFSTLMQSFGADSKMFSININDRVIIDLIFEKVLKLNSDQSLKLYKVIDKSKKVSKEALDKMISEIIHDEKIKSDFKNYLAIDSFNSLQLYLDNHGIDSSLSSLLRLNSILEKSSIKSFIKYDPTIVRGLDYYTGIVFECFDKHPENNRAIAGGGAYANLLQIFKEQPLSGFGFGMGDVTFKDFLTSHKLIPSFKNQDSEVSLSYFDDESTSYALSFAKDLRENNIKVDMNLGKIKPNKTTKVALNKGINFLIQIGRQEKENNEVQVRNLDSKENKNFSVSNIKEIIQFIKGNK